MTTVADVAEFLESLAPLSLAEPWDNVGLLVGRRGQKAARIMTCLTITPASAAEAVQARADLIVTHHPLPFRPLKRITDGQMEGTLLLDLLAARIAVYSAHTAFDSASQGINQRLAEILQLRGAEPLVPAAQQVAENGGFVGTGRCGLAPQPAGTLSAVVRKLKKALQLDRVQIVGAPDQQVRKIAVACGSAGELLAPAVDRGCDCFVTGEARFHTCLEAESRGVAMVLLGHYASERFGAEALAAVLAAEFPRTTVWASQKEADPLRWL